MLPVSELGALLFVGDGHAKQGHGELVGSGIEISMDVEFTVDLIKGKTIGWPRVKASCEYAGPARYGDTLDITVRVLRKGTSSMTYEIEFEIDGRRVARGESTSVRCELGPEMRSIPISDALARRIEEG